MRRFVTDKRLHLVLNAIEQWQGSPVLLETLSPELRKARECSVCFQGNLFCFSAFPGETYSQTIICHELMHLCLLIDGWPNFRWKIPLADLPEDSWQYNTLSTLKNLVHHVEIWRLTSATGYSEQEDRSREIEHRLIPIVTGNRFFPKFPPHTGIPARAIFLAEHY